MHSDANVTPVALNQTDQVVTSNPCKVYGIYVTALGASDVISIKDGNAVVFNVVPSTLATIGSYPLGNFGKGLRFENGIKVTTGANESCLIFWKDD